MQSDQYANEATSEGDHKHMAFHIDKLVDEVFKRINACPMFADCVNDNNNNYSSGKTMGGNS